MAGRGVSYVYVSVRGCLLNPGTLSEGCCVEVYGNGNAESTPVSSSCIWPAKMGVHAIHFPADLK